MSCAWSSLELPALEAIGASVEVGSSESLMSCVLLFWIALLLCLFDLGDADARLELIRAGPSTCIVGMIMGLLAEKGVREDVRWALLAR